MIEQVLDLKEAALSRIRDAGAARVDGTALSLQLFAASARRCAGATRTASPVLDACC